MSGSFTSRHPSENAISFTGSPGTASKALNATATSQRKARCDPVEKTQQTVAMANSTYYGLATVLRSENINRALHVAPQIRVGHAWINSWQMRDLNSPGTGAGISGMGEHFGRSSLEFCSQPQTITVRVFD